jgi:hypothetical protein
MFKTLLYSLLSIDILCFIGVISRSKKNSIGGLNLKGAIGASIFFVVGVLLVVFIAAS